MAGKIIVSSVQSDTDNSISFVANTGATIFSANLSHGIAGSFIADGTITAAKIADGAIVATEIADGAVTGPKLGLTSINANNIVNGTITGAKLAANTVTGDVIGQSAISSNNISSITSNKLSDAGLVRITSGTLSGASGITLDGIFTSTYKNYYVFINTTLNLSGGSDNDIFFQFRAGGSTNSSGNYAFNVNYINAGLNAGTAASSTGSATSWVLYDNMDDGSVFNGYIQFYNPQVTGESQANWFLYGADNGYRKQMLGFGSQSQSTSFDGINIFMSGGSLTGTYDVYGVAR